MDDDSNDETSTSEEDTDFEGPLLAGRRSNHALASANLPRQSIGVQEYEPVTYTLRPAFYSRFPDNDANIVVSIDRRPMYCLRCRFFFPPWAEDREKTVKPYLRLCMPINRICPFEMRPRGPDSWTWVVFRFCMSAHNAKTVSTHILSSIKG